FKPELTSGSGKVQVVRMILLVSSSDAITLKVDDSVIFVTRGQLTPKAITAITKNAVDETGHSHEIDKASTSQAGIVELDSSINSKAENKAATPKAVKTAYDKAKAADDNANTRVSKSGGEMTGGLKLKANYGASEKKWDYSGFYAGSATLNNEDLPYFQIHIGSYGGNTAGYAKSLGFNLTNYKAYVMNWNSGGEYAGKKEILTELHRSDSVTSASSETVATSKAVKTAYDKAVDGVNKADAAQTAANNAQTTANAAIPSSKKSDSVASTSSETVATSKAVKTAYDKAVDGVNKANAAYKRAETAEINAKAASLPITGGNLSGDLIAPYINVTGRYISVNTPNSEFGGFDVIRQGNAGNWLSRLEALPDKRWKFWTQDAYETFVPAKSGTLAIDHEVVHKTGDVMNWLSIENTGAWLTIKSTGQASSGIDFVNCNGRYPQVSLHAFDVGGWADELRIFATPPGNDYNTDRRQHVMTVTHEGNIWSKMYGWLGDRFMDKTKAYDNWYPNHYLGAQVFKIPLRADGSGLKIIIMQVNISRDTELWLPESFNGFYIPTATDFGGGKYSLGIQSIGSNKVKVYCSGSNVTIQVHCIGWGY
ncbi:tail fiber protein, partial [Gallibacterium anatis]|uniref:tail fiber protein n=1 Tax=Gallibacterium anatis TaxID=750 RepID=UPI000531A8E4